MFITSSFLTVLRFSWLVLATVKSKLLIGGLIWDEFVFRVFSILSSLFAKIGKLLKLKSRESYELSICL